jgi:hypothetical protein
MGQQTVNQGALEVAGARMNNHARGLVYNQYVFILVEKLEGHGLGGKLVLNGKDGKPYRNAVSDTHFIARFYGTLINKHRPIMDQLFELASRDIRTLATQKQVEALFAILRTDCECKIARTILLSSFFTHKFFCLRNRTTSCKTKLAVCSPKA